MFSTASNNIVETAENRTNKLRGTPAYNTYVDVEPAKWKRLRRGRHPRRVPVELMTSPVPFHRQHRSSVQIVIAVEHDILPSLHRRRYELYADVVQTPDDI